MNIMFLLIPALLLAMEVASMSAIVVAPPKFVDRPVNADPPPQQKPLGFKVRIESDGFFVRASAAQLGEDRISRKGEELDHAALLAVATELKQQYGDETVVTVSAEQDIAYAEIVATMDTLRGEGCSLRDPARAGCLFWQPIVDAS